MPRTVETDHRQIVDISAQTSGNILEVVFDSSIDVDGASRRRSDDDLVHVYIGRVQQTAALGGRKDSDRVIRTERAQVRTLERIDRDIDFRKLAARVIRERAAAHL